MSAPARGSAATSSLGQNVFVGNRVVIGDDCKIQNNVSVYDGVMLEDGVFCGPSDGLHQRLQPARAGRAQGRVSRHVVRTRRDAWRQLHDRLRRRRSANMPSSPPARW